VRPVGDGKYGCVFFGNDDLTPQGGVNEKGLFFVGQYEFKPGLLTVNAYARTVTTHSAPGAPPVARHADRYPDKLCTQRTPMDSHWQLRVSRDKRTLVKADGSPWFWLGDTAWALFIHLDRDEIHRYFEDRQKKGFSVIQGVVLMGYNVDFNAPNTYGHRPLVDSDPTRPDTGGAENFWTHVDFIIDTAAQYGLHIGLLPTWGYHIGGNQNTPIVFRRESAETYARWIANRYKDRPNIIWINGGDIKGEENGDTDIEIWRTMGRVYKQTCPDHLVTFHPCGTRSSSYNFHGDDWLDFNMIQSGHRDKGGRNDDMIAADYAREPVKPVLDGEPRYEDHPVGWNPQKGFFHDYDARQAAYFSLFAGSFGHTYGHVNLWRFNVPGKVRTKERFSMLDLYWVDLLDSPGAWQMHYVRKLMTSRPQQGRVPDPSILATNYGGERRQLATRGDGHVFIYAPYGDPIEIDPDKIPWAKSGYQWYDPRTGMSLFSSEQATENPLRFQPPGNPCRTNDWVLVIDDKTKRNSAPQ